MSISSVIGRTSESVLDMIYPDSLYCICCGNMIDESRPYALCDHCMRHIKWDLEPAMEKEGIMMMRCCEYGIYTRSMIFSLKYNGKRYIARKIADMMRDKISLLAETVASTGDYDFDVVVPVPMHKDKERHRGFNQTALIGKYLSKSLGCELMPDALIRVHDTRPMRGLSPDEREENIKGAFSANDSQTDLHGKRVLLIDDFYTTGATARECVKALSKFEPHSVMFYAFAAR